MAEECPLLCIASVEFDIDKGNTLSAVFPSEYDFRQFSQTNIADLCLPDGAHIHTEDWTYLFLHKNSGDTSIKSPSASTSPSGQPDAPISAKSRSQLANPVDIVYGIAFFKKKADSSVKRGAIQKSVLFLSTKPCYALFEPLVRATVDQLLNTGDKAAPKKMLEAFQKNWAKNKTFVLWDKTFSTMPPRTQNISNSKKVADSSAMGVGTTSNEPQLEIVSNAAVKGGPAAPFGVLRFEPDEFDGASLTDVVNRFGVDTMYLWYTILLEQRILFAGQPAHLVGQCCLACPLLVAPLKGFAKYIHPYVALTDLGPLERDNVYIAGTTNQLLETKTEWYDMMAGFSTGIVRKSNAKLSTLDKEFILNVMSGMHAGEKWVRDQFRNYTVSFLESVRSGHYLSQQHEALGEPFKLSPLYERYLSELATLGLNSSSKAHVQALDAIRAEGLHMDDHKKKQYLWELLQKLVDLQSIDEICQLDGLPAIAPLLNDNSAQVRKYAVAILAQMAISIRGQISLVQNNLIPRVVLMLRDPMPNVASAAAYCLYKISTLYIGVCALVQARVPKILLNMICSEDDNLVLKISAVETLKQIYLLDPTCPIVGKDNVKQVLRHSSDLQFKSLLCQLLDLWGEERVPVKVSEAIQLSLVSLRGAVGMDVKTSTTSMLLSDISQDPLLLLELIAAGGVQLVLSNIRETHRTEPLARLSMAILCIIVDASMGRAAINGQDVVKSIVSEADASDYPLYLYYVYRFFEVCCQHKSTTKHFLANGGLGKLLTAISKYADKPTLRTLLLPCLGALKWLMLLNPSIAEPLASQLQSLKTVYSTVELSMENSSGADANVSEEVLATLRTVIELYDPSYVRAVISDGSELTEHSETEDVIAGRGRSVSPIDRASRAPRSIEDPSKVKQPARRKSINMKMDLISEADSILGELEADVKPPKPTQTTDTESSEMDSEIDQFMSGGFKRISYERRGTISFSDRNAFAASLQIDLSDIDAITSQIADDLMSSRAKENKEAPEEDDDLEDIVNKLLSDTPRSKSAKGKSTPRSDDADADIDDLDNLANDLLEKSSTASSRDKRRSTPVTLNMVVSNIGLVELIEAAGEGLHIPEGKTKGFSTPKAVPVAADPKWDDLDSLTDDLLSEGQSIPNRDISASAPAILSPRAKSPRPVEPALVEPHKAADGAPAASAPTHAPASEQVAGKDSLVESATRTKHHGRQKSGGEKVSFLAPIPEDSPPTPAEWDVSPREDSSSEKKSRSKDKDKKDKDKDKEKDKEKEKDKKHKEKEKQKHTERDNKHEERESSKSGTTSPNKRRSRELSKFSISTPANPTTASSVSNKEEKSAASGTIDDLDAVVDQLLDM